jgi:hypothetical protein
MAKSLEVLEVNDWKMDGGLIAVPVQTEEGLITLRLT